ncbi:signal peptidase II [Chitinibacter tainanensis]|uniref:signal peptidase II n=1 Tax=Chitinibacter tainanensis TaxID=230667 RepID=UPI002355475A|nr:signal peptidase II [Chitinibacter tainanensis]
MSTSQLVQYFNQSMTVAKAELKVGNFSGAFCHLEKAHILGQQQLLRHWTVHCWMLRVASAQHNWAEAAGQIWRIILTPLGHMIGRLPQGNTGRANVNAFIPMPIPQELQQILDMNTSSTNSAICTELVTPSANAYSSKPLFLVWVFLASMLTLFDQAIKISTATLLPLNGSMAITPWFNWVHVLNPGAAFSFLADAGGWQRHFFTIVAGLVCTYLLCLLWRGLKSRLETVAYIFIVGGALGNVIDRIRIGAVVDYLDFYWRTWHWPAFNLADIFVVIGALLMAISAIKNQLK